MLGHVEVLRVVQVGVEPILNTANDSGFQINQEGPRNIVLIVSLIEEDILPIVALCRIILQYSIFANSMLPAQLLPKLISNYISNSFRLVIKNENILTLISALTYLEGDYFSWHFSFSLLICIFLIINF